MRVCTSSRDLDYNNMGPPNGSRSRLSTTKGKLCVTSRVFNWMLLLFAIIMDVPEIREPMNARDN